MAIPETQLDTWSHQGSIAQSSATYATIKNALEASGTAYSGRDYKVFLQGSYGNDTNIYAESDVDVVIQYNDVYFSDTSDLTSDEKAAYERARTDGGYSYYQYKQDVFSALAAKFGSDVTSGDKAIAVAANGSRRKADVVAAMQFRKYTRFRSATDNSFVGGICFYNSRGDRIVNYPKQHSANMTTKHQSSGTWLKPMVRILKNMRSRLVRDGKLQAKTAPSYYLEGLLYNAPNSRFGTSYANCFVNVMNWIQNDADKDKLVCANEQYYLLRDGFHTCWPKADAETFLSAAISCWNNW
jgi:hypothetical protein